jgi:NTE family protein
MTISLLIGIIALAGWTFPVKAESSDMERPDRPKIGLVLGGGGAKGAAHIGVLNGFGFSGALSEIRLPQAHIPLALLFFK